jgi:RNA polymerase sigma factor (sigma-70 family)
MARGVSGAVGREIRTLFTIGAAGALTDPELLERFLSRHREEAEVAFAELVARHGPMVLGTCRRILRDAHDAEDAFQATFLVLVRRAASVARREQLAGWLYGVAVRTAQSARARAERRRAGEKRAMRAARGESYQEEGRGQFDGLLDEELGRLPEKYRMPVILCELEGISRREAAHQLGVPEGTVASRLARGRGLLRDRLQRRGLGAITIATLSAGSRIATAAEVPPMLIENTVRIAVSLRFGEATAGVFSASVSSIVEGEMKQMLLAKLKTVSLALLAAGAVSAAVAQVASEPAGTDPRPGDSPSQPGRQATTIDALPPISDSPPDPVMGVKEVLESATKNSNWHQRHQRFSMKVKSKDRGPREVDTEVVIRKDGPKLDYHSKTVLLGQPENYPGNVTTRMIDDGTFHLVRTTTIGRRNLSGGVTVANRESYSARAFYGSGLGFALDGYLAGNQRKRLVEILAATPQLAAKEEFVNGVRCLHVSARTEYGDLAVWLDPASHYCLRKAAMYKERGNIYEGSRFGEHIDTTQSESFRETVSDLEYEKFGDSLIPTRGTVTSTYTPNGRAPERWVSTITRSEVELNPAFKGTDAFKIDLEDGARVTNWDAYSTDSFYIWRDGKLIPQIESRRPVASNPK